MSKMLKYAVLFFLIIFAWYGIKKIIFFWYMSHYQAPAVTVSATYANSKTWQSSISAVGSLSAVQGVDLAAETSGVITAIYFNSGQYIKKDALILSLRTESEEAELKSSQAKLALAKMNYEREHTLFNKKVSPQAVLDLRYAELLQEQAHVDAILAKIHQKNIRAPFSGRLGIRLVNLGQYVPAGTPLVTLQALDPLYVLFHLPEHYLPDLYLGQSIAVAINSAKDKTVQGEITAIDSKVDPATRSVLVQATIANQHYSLYPGMYGLVKVWLKEKTNRIVIPQTAISFSLSGDYVFLVKEEFKNKKTNMLRAYRQFVKVGEQKGNEAAILEGVKTNDRIVTSGQLKLQNGSTILIDNSQEL
jgi:membrane fusion protein, multidrug efflux system